MIHLNKFLKFSNHFLLGRRLTHDFSQFKIKQIKNNSILILEDFKNELPYMAEVLTDKYGKGVVLKLEDQSSVYLAMYDRIEDYPQSIEISSVGSWKKSSEIITNQKSSQNKSKIFDVNLSLLQEEALQNQRQSQQPKQTQTAKKKRLRVSSPVLGVCYDLFQGDMISFLGCRGSKKTQSAQSIIKQFGIVQKDSVCVYVNPFHRQVLKLGQATKIIGFSVPPNTQATDVGVYFLTLKAVNTCIELKKQGRNVLLVIDNLQDIMMREWSLLQTIKFNSKTADSSKSFQYNTLKISPISILNEIYSNCGDETRRTKPSGSLSAILISEPESTQLVQEISTFGNNIKHLQSLSKVVQFPLKLKVNSNRFSASRIPSQNCSQRQALYQFVREQINKYLTELIATELKRSLYKSDMKDAPWDYYSLLDAEWWVNDLKNINFQTEVQALDFFRWIRFNIEQEYTSRWTISATKSFLKFKQFSQARTLTEGQAGQALNFDEETLEQFIQDAKMEDIFTPFKKDYLY